MILCKHKQLEVIRAHQESEYGKENRRKAIVIDRHDCVVFVRCAKCKKIIDMPPADCFEFLRH